VTVSRVLTGVGVAPGVRIGPARVIRWDLPEVTRSVVPADLVDAEVRRLRDAIAAVRADLEELRERARERAGAEEAKIFDAQIMMLEDPVFLDEVTTLIRGNQLSAERAFEFKTLEMRALWAQSPNFVLRQRVADLTGLQVRVLNRLVSGEAPTPPPVGNDRPAIVFTRELTPGLTVQLERDRVAAVAAVEGGRTAHAAILARSLGIPCVMGLIDGLGSVADGTEVILDGTHGFVVLDPTPAEIAGIEESERLRGELDRHLATIGGADSDTKDGVGITLRANLELPEEMDGALHFGARGIGLLRTEFLILGRTTMPSEDEQAQFFADVARRFAGHPVIVRSYDLGGDKFPAAFPTPPEANPFLGWRAIRVCLDQPEVFHGQLRALLRARLAGDVRLMLPMVTRLDEIDRTMELINEAANDLDRQGVAAARDLPVGVMVETPAAALLVDAIGARARFVSVGTNDLTQYTLAVDRGNARLAGRFTPHHPAVVRLLGQVAESAARNGIEASVCGEMASDPMSAFLLLGLGYRVLSVSAPTLPMVRWTVRQVEHRAAVQAAREALAATTTQEVEAVLERSMGRYVDLKLIRAGRLPGIYRTASLHRT
jgi:phosphotransferase system enzyme I (PtsI)